MNAKAAWIDRAVCAVAVCFCSTLPAAAAATDTGDVGPHNPATWISTTPPNIGSSGEGSVIVNGGSDYGQALGGGSPAPAPEPSAMVMLVVGAAAILLLRRRSRENGL